MHTKNVLFDYSNYDRYCDKNESHKICFKKHINVQ